MTLNNTIVQNTNTVVLSAANQLASVFLIFANFSLSSEVLSVYIVKSGDVPGNNNIYIKDAIIQPADAMVLNNIEKLILETGDSIVAIGATGNLVNCTASSLDL